MIQPGEKELTTWVRGSAGSGRREVQGVAWRHCFDDAAPGEFHPMVLLAAVAEVRKCCPRTLRLSADGQQCEAVAEEGERNTDEQEGMREVLGEEAMENSTWIPPSLNATLKSSDGRVRVMYNTNWGLETVKVSDADVEGEWVLEFPDDVPPEIWLTDKSRTTRQKVDNWCFDVQVDRGRVLVWDVSCKAAGVLCLPKCCPTGSLLGEDGRCRKRPSDVHDWNPNHSAISRFLPINRTLVAHNLRWIPCTDGAFFGHSPDVKDAVYNLQFPYDIGRFYIRYYCTDFQLGDDGAVQEAFAYCVLPPIGSVYIVIRPLQMVAVLLLVVALVSMLYEVFKRISLHGCALACHTTCLLLSNSLQTAWFFWHDVDRPCHLFAYAIYFFMVAAGVWLNVVSINMAWGFRQPLGAHTAGQPGRPMWRSLALWSVYGWGVPAALTTLTVCMHMYADRLYNTPTFFETRTCFSEEDINEDGSRKLFLGVVFYYYVPMSMLVIANGVCLIITTSTIMAMKKETAVLRQMGSCTAANRGLQNARMYVKLLLSAGLVELAVEVAAWAARKRISSPIISRNTVQSQQITYIFNIVATFVDVARALAILWLVAGRWRWPWAWPGSWWRRAAALVREAWSSLPRQASTPPASILLSTLSTSSPPSPATSALQSSTTLK